MSKERFSTQVDAEVAARARATVLGIQQLKGPGSITLSALTTNALLAEIVRLEADYNAGEPFPPLEADQLSPGARITGPVPSRGGTS